MIEASNKELAQLRAEVSAAKAERDAAVQAAMVAEETRDRASRDNIGATQQARERHESCALLAPCALRTIPRPFVRS
jgi:hypothetical protein